MSSLPTLQSITWLRGDSFSASLTIGTGSLVGSDIWFTVKTDRALPDSVAVVSATVGNGVTIESATTAKIVVSAAVMAALAPGTYRYDVQVKKPDGSVKTIVEGMFAVKADVTRAI